MLIKVVEKYVNMGGSQFLRDYRMSVKLKKTAELRKHVMEKRNKQRQRTDSVPFQVKVMMSLIRHTPDLTGIKSSRVVQTL